MSAALWMLLAQVFFALMNLGTRLAAREVNWPQTAFVRFMVGAAVAAAIGRARGKSLRATDQKHTWLRSIFGTLAALGSFYALSSPRLPLGDAATLGATSPIFVALLAPMLLHERVGHGLVGSILTAFVGVALLLQPTFGGAAPVALVATAAAGSYALAMIWLRKIGPSETAEAVVLHFSIVAAVTTFALSLPSWRNPSAGGWLLLVGTGLSGGAAQLAMTRAFARDRAARISALGYLQVALTYLLAALAFGEHPAPVQLAGAAMVLAASLYITLRL